MKKVKLVISVVFLLFVGSGYRDILAVGVEASAINERYEIDINDKDIEVSEVLTFDEIVRELARDENITILEAEKTMLGNRSGRSNELARKSTYRTISQQFLVKNNYRPTMRFYCETTEGGNFRAIRRIRTVNMNRNSNGMSKQFSGSVYTKLEDPNRIFYIVNGDFYNNGTTTFNGNVDIPVYAGASVTFGVSHARNHFGYIYREAFVRF